MPHYLGARKVRDVHLQQISLRNIQRTESVGGTEFVRKLIAVAGDLRSDIGGIFSHATDQR